MPDVHGNSQLKHDSKALDRYIQLSSLGDSAAFSMLYKAASTAVYSYALSVLKNTHDAEDVLQDCFINIYNSAASYKSCGKPMAWIITIARNLCLQCLKERSRNSQLPEEDWEKYLYDSKGISDDDRLTLYACMNGLQDEERKILVLHAVAGFKHREIAEFLEMPLATVLSKYSRAAKKLRTILEKENLQ